MYKILMRSLTRPEKSLANFTSIYRRVANNRHSSTTSQTKNSVPPNHTEGEEGNSSKSKQKPSLRTKSSQFVSNGKGFSFPKRSWLAEAKDTVHIMMFSTSTSKYFYASTLNQAKQPLISQKYFKNQKALDLYKQALEQCMKIKFERHRIQRKNKNVAWTPPPFKPNNVNEKIALARSKIEETLPSENRSKKILKPHSKKSISVEEIKHLVKQKKALQYVKKKKFQIVYPTHIIKYKLGLDKPYHVEKSMAKKLLRSVVSTSEPEMDSVKSVSKREINTVEVMPPKKEQNNDLLAVMMASKKRREKGVVADGTTQHLISQHPEMKRVTERAKMSINKKYNIIMLKNQAKIKLQMKPNQVTPGTFEEFELNTIPAKQKEKFTQVEQTESEENNIQRELESDKNIVEHPISTNLDQTDLQLNIKYPKRLLSEKNETFDIEDICLKTKESYIVYTDAISDAIKKMTQGTESLRREAPEKDKNIDKKEDDVSNKHLVEQRLKELPKRNEKQKQSASVSSQKLETTAQSLIGYLKKLNDFKVQSSMERSSIKKQFSKTTATQEDEVNKVDITEDEGESCNGVKNKIIKQQQGISKAGSIKEENKERNSISNLSNSLQEKLLQQKVAQELIGKQHILTMKKEEEVVRKTDIPRIKTLSSSQSTETSIRKTTSKYLLENIKPIRNTDDQTEEVPLKKTDAKEPSKNQRFQKILSQYIVKPTHTGHEIDAPKNEENVDKSKPRSIDLTIVPGYPDQKIPTPVEDITEEDEYSPHNRENLKTISKYANHRLEQKTFRLDKDKIVSEEDTKKEPDRKIEEPDEEIIVVTMKDEHNLYKDKLKNMLEPANQYFERLREAGENRIKTLGALKDQFKSQISENISKGLKMKNMLENIPKNVVESDKKLSTNTFMVDDVGKESKPKKIEKPSSSKDSCLLVFEESTGKDEVYDVIQIDLDNKKSKPTHGKLQTSNNENNKQNTLPNDRPTIRQERPPQRPATKNINDKKDESTGSSNVIPPPPRSNDSPKSSMNLDSRLNKNETRSNKENEAGPSWPKKKLNDLEIKHKKIASEDSVGVKQDIMKDKCAQELEDLEHIIFKTKPRTRECLDAAFIPEEFPNQQLFRNWLSILNSIEKLEIEYKDGSDSKLIRLGKEVDIVEKNLNTDESPVGNSQIGFDPFKKTGDFQTIEKDIISEEEEKERQYRKVHPNWLNNEKPDANISSEENRSYNDNKLKLIPEDREKKSVQKTLKPVNEILISRNEEKIKLISGEVKQEPAMKSAISKENDTEEHGIRGLHPEELDSKKKLDGKKNVEFGEPELNVKKSVVIPDKNSEDQGMITHLETLKSENLSPFTSRKLGQHVIAEKGENKIATPPPKMMDYEKSSENMGITKIEQKIEDKAIFPQQILRSPRKNTESAIKQKEKSDEKLSQKKARGENNGTTKQAKVDIKSTPSKPINSCVKVSNTSSMRYSGPKLSVEKEQKQTSEQWKPTFGHKSTSNLVKKVTIEENNNSKATKKVEQSNICNLNNKHGLEHQSQTSADVESKEKEVQKAKSGSGNKIRGKSETRLMMMYMLDENEGYYEFIAGLREKINQPKISSENVDMKKPTDKPVSKQNFKPKHVLDLSRKQITTDLKPSENTSKKDSKSIRMVEEATFRRNNIPDDMKKILPRDEPKGKSTKVSSTNENENKKKLMIVQEEKKIKPLGGIVENSKMSSSCEDRLKDNSKKSNGDVGKTESPEKPMAVQESEKLKPLQKSVAESKLSLVCIIQNDKLRDYSKKCNENIEKTKATKSLGDLDKNTSSPDGLSDYSRKAKENRNTKAKSPINELSSQEKHEEKRMAMLVKEKSKLIQESVVKSKMDLVSPMQNDKLKGNSKKCNEDVEKTRTTKSLGELDKNTSSPDRLSDYSRNAKENRNTKAKSPIAEHSPQEKHEEKRMTMLVKEKSKLIQESVVESKIDPKVCPMQNEKLKDNSKKCNEDVEKTRTTKSLKQLNKDTSSPDCSSYYSNKIKENQDIKDKLLVYERSSQSEEKQMTVQGKQKSKHLQESKVGKMCSEKSNENMKKTSKKSIKEFNKVTSPPDCSSDYVQKTKVTRDTNAKSAVYKHPSQEKREILTTKQEKEKRIQRNVAETKMNTSLKDNSKKSNMEKTKTIKSLEELNKSTSPSDCFEDYFKKAKKSRNTEDKLLVDEYSSQEKREKPTTKQEKEKRIQRNVAETKMSTSLKDNSKKSNMEKTKPIKSLEELNKSTSPPDCFVDHFKKAKKSRNTEDKMLVDEYSSHEKNKEKPMTMQEKILQETVSDSIVCQKIKSREGQLKDKQSNDIGKTTTTKSLEEPNKVSSASDGYSGYSKKIDECLKTNVKSVAHKKPPGVKYREKNDTDIPNQPKSTTKIVCENKSNDNKVGLLDGSPETEEKKGISKVKRLGEGKMVNTVILNKTEDNKPEIKICTSNSAKVSSKSEDTEHETKSRENSQNMTNVNPYLVSNRSSPNPPKKSETSNESSKKINEESPGNKAKNKDYSDIAVRKPEEITNKLMKTDYIEDIITKNNECDIKLKKSSNISENASKKSSPTILEAGPAKDLAEENKAKPEVTKENPKDKSTGPGKKHKVIIRLNRYPSSLNPTKPTSKKNDSVPNTNSKEESSKHQAKIKEILSIGPKTVLDYIIDNQLKKRNIKPERMLEEAKILKQKYHNERLHKVMDKYRADIDKIEDSYNQKIAPADEELLRQRKYKENELEAFKRKIEDGTVKKELPKKVEHEANHGRGRVQNARISTEDSSSYADNKMKANYQSYLLKNKATKLKLIARAKSSKYLLENQVNYMRKMKIIKKQKNECYIMKKIGMEKKNTFKLILKVPHKGHRANEITTKVDDIFIEKERRRSNKDLLDEHQLPAELISSNRTFPTENKKQECKSSSSKYLLENKTLVSTEKFKTNGNECGIPNSPKGSKKLHSDAAITISGKIKAGISKILPTLSIIENQSQFGKMLIDADLSSIFPDVPQNNEDRKDKAEIKEIFHRREKLLKFNKKLADYMITQSTENQLKNKSVDSNLNKFLVTDLEKKERYKECVCDSDQSNKKETELQHDRPRNFLGTIVLRKNVDRTEKPKAKLTMEKELPKYPPEKKKTDNKKSITKSCDKLCVPPKTISQAFYSQPRDDITTLTKCSNDRIVSIPNKPVKKFDIYEKYKGLKISFITVRRTEKKKDEHFLPALLSMEGEKNTNESIQNLENKAKILAFRREFLKKLKEEFDFLDKNQHNFQKVREHYERVLGESTENNDNKSVFKFPTIQERPKNKDNTVPDSMLSLDSNHVPKNGTRLLIKKLTNKEANDNKESETPEKPKIDPKKK